MDAVNTAAEVVGSFSEVVEVEVVLLVFNETPSVSDGSGGVEDGGGGNGAEGKDEGAPVTVGGLLDVSTSGKTKTESSGAETRRTSRLASKQKLVLMHSSEIAAARSADNQRSK